MKRKIDRAVAAREPQVVWNSFVDLCAMEEYADLSPTQRQGHLVFWYDAEVQNGGHLQYFLNRGTDLLEETITALRVLELGCHADLLYRVGKVWEATEREAPRTPEEYSYRALAGEFDEHDRAFHQCSPTVVEGLERHLEKHQLDYVEFV